jgi:hypothetical protein
MVSARLERDSAVRSSTGFSGGTESPRREEHQPGIYRESILARDLGNPAVVSRADEEGPSLHGRQRRRVTRPAVLALAGPTPPPFRRWMVDVSRATPAPPHRDRTETCFSRAGRRGDERRRSVTKQPDSVHRADSSPGSEGATSAREPAEPDASVSRGNTEPRATAATARRLSGSDRLRRKSPGRATLGASRAATARISDPCETSAEARRHDGRSVSRGQMFFTPTPPRGSACTGFSLAL